MLLMFQICFFAGLGLILISFLLGEFFDFIGVDGLDLDGFDINLIVPLSPTLLILMATVFGGTGLALLKMKVRIHSALIVIIALAVGYSITYLVNRFVVKPLKKAENTSALPQEEMVGCPAVVTERISKNGFGQIKYTMKGNTYTSPAKAVNEEEIPAGTDVSICWIEDHIFYVTHINI